MHALKGYIVTSQKPTKQTRLRRMQTGHVDYKDFKIQNLLAWLQFRSKIYFEVKSHYSLCFNSQVNCYTFNKKNLKKEENVSLNLQKKHEDQSLDDNGYSKNSI
jgi:hypothetical protein